MTVSLTDTIVTDVVLDFIGHPVATEEGGVLSTPISSVSIEVLATRIPSAIEVDVSEMTMTDSIRISDLPEMEGSPTSTIPSRRSRRSSSLGRCSRKRKGGLAEGEELEEGEEAAAGDESEEGAEKQSEESSGIGPVKAAIGLRNPGPEIRRYPSQRRVRGDRSPLCTARCHAETGAGRVRADVADVRFGAQRLVLAAPQSFMNESGRPVVFRREVFQDRARGPAGRL